MLLSSPLSSGTHLSKCSIQRHDRRLRLVRVTKVRCSSSEDDRGISRTARIRDEVISPFRSLRMFLYPALMASATIAGLSALPRLIAALSNSPNAEYSLEEVLQGLGIDIAAALVFALLYRSDSKARDLQLAKLSREEKLASLKVELPNKRVATLEQMRGSARFVIIAGPKSHVDQALQLSQPFQQQLMERGVTLVPFVTTDDEEDSALSFSVSEDDEAAAARRWIVSPIYTTEWSRYCPPQFYNLQPLVTRHIMQLVERAETAWKVCSYLSLRMDGRVRGSGVGSPPWNALVAQLPPLKGMWRGTFDGMDGRV